ncbi:hypothetical protein JCM24511_05851 [Saitozyma sp. JCM 24511]|nr:hypothetical protein JCM24511_05851 [Saitozyma sp. JCM 24511]
MPPRKAPAAVSAAPATPPNPGPVPPLASPTIEAEPDSIDPAPNHDQEQYTLPPTAPMGDDEPGPSSTYIPRQPSPPLPDLNTRPFPPDDDHSSDEESDDEVVASLPIYLSPNLFPHLNLFQYPLHTRSLSAPSWARDRGKRITARVKERVGRVEVELPVDGTAEVWRDDKAREMGFVTDVNANGHGDDIVGGYGFGGKEKEKDKRKKSAKKEEKWGDKARLRSEVVPNATGYYSGVVHDGALHLHPISKTMQFRTSLAYIDDMEQKNRERAARRRGDNEEEEVGRPRSAAPGPAGAAGRPGIRKVLEDEENDGSGSIKDFRNKMWSTAANEEADSWVPYEWKEGEDDLVAKSFQSLLVAEDKHVRLGCRTRGLDYLNRGA